MQFSKEMGLILFDGYYEGGALVDGEPNPKVRQGKKKPKPYEIAKREYQWLLGKIKQSIVLTNYDSDETFQCRLKMAQALDQHCIAIKGAHKGGHIYWANCTQAVTTSNTKMKTVLTLAPVDYKCGVKMVKHTGEIKLADTYGALQNDDGTFREVLYFNPGPGDNLDELPFYDRPLQSGEKHQFLGMADGEGRQEGLFTFMIPMKEAGFTYEHSSRGERNCKVPGPLWALFPSQRYASPGEMVSCRPAGRNTPKQRQRPPAGKAQISLFRSLQNFRCFSQRFRPGFVLKSRPLDRTKYFAKTTCNITANRII